MVSYILGVASVLMMQSLNYRVMKDLYKNNPTKIKSRTIWLYIARFIFYGVILYVVYGSDKWNMYYTLAGLITFKIVLVVITLIFANKGDDSDEI
jgi:cell division protein FtsW (lipid II flippase)